MCQWRIRLPVRVAGSVGDMVEGAARGLLTAPATVTASAMTEPEPRSPVTARVTVTVCVTVCDGMRHSLSQFVARPRLGPGPGWAGQRKFGQALYFATS